MHEIGYVESLLPVLESRAAGRQVTAVGVRAGVLHRLVDASFQQAFEMVTAGSSVEGATVKLEQVPIEVTCSACDSTTPAEAEAPACPACGSTDISNSSGDEFTLHWVRYADDD